MNRTLMHVTLLRFWKMIRITAWLPAILVCGLPFACSKDEDPSMDASDGYAAINKWILENMSDYYLWTQHIPQKTNQALYPKEYFEALIYERETIDRFSWIQDNFVELMQSLSGVSKEAGYDYSLLKWSENSDAVVGCINYIKRGSPAEQAGLKRGDVFAAVNGTALNINNYSSLMGQTGEQHTLGLISLSQAALTLAIDKTVQLPVTVYAENPILLDSVYTVNNVRIGYLIYNFFANDDGNGNIAYAKQLNEVFGRFINANIGELIIDLRYNSGGALVTTEALAAMISGKGASDLFGLSEYNPAVSAMLIKQYGADYNRIYFPDNLYKYDANNKVAEQVTINKLRNMSRVYFIVSGRSASASEMLINAVRPYMAVTLIGTQTYGKNVGSITLYEEDPKKQESNQWGMQPIVVKYANAYGFSDYPAGFTPDVIQRELTSLPLKPLGDTSETVLNVTLSEIFGLPITLSKTVKQRNVIGSSIDRTPIRNNTVLDPRDALPRTIRQMR